MARPFKHETFLYRVYKNVRPTVSGCVEFTGCKSDDGYGRINKNGKLVYIHREIFKEFNGDFDAKLSVCHKCDNPSCINPNHLFLGTHTDNMRDMFSKGRRRITSGEKSAKAKLRDLDIPVIRQRIASGESCYGIARDYGVNGETILHIKHGRSWASVK